MFIFPHLPLPTCYMCAYFLVDYIMYEITLRIQVYISHSYKWYSAVCFFSNLDGCSPQQRKLYTELFGLLKDGHLAKLACEEVSYFC